MERLYQARPIVIWLQILASTLTRSFTKIILSLPEKEGNPPFFLKIDTHKENTEPHTRLKQIGLQLP